MEPTIRVMQQVDVDGVYAIEQLNIVPWSRDIISDCILVGYDCRVLELTLETTTKTEKCIVGYIISRLSLGSYHILNISIESNEKGKGYGKLLLKTVIDSLQNKTIEKIILEVRESNIVARNLYEKFNFQKTGVNPGYYKDELGEEDAWIFEKSMKICL